MRGSKRIIPPEKEGLESISPTSRGEGKKKKQSTLFERELRKREGVLSENITRPSAARPIEGEGGG